MFCLLTPHLLLRNTEYYLWTYRAGTYRLCDRLLQIVDTTKHAGSFSDNSICTSTKASERKIGLGYS